MLIDIMSLMLIFPYFLVFSNAEQFDKFWNVGDFFVCSHTQPKTLNGNACVEHSFKMFAFGLFNSLLFLCLSL